MKLKTKLTDLWFEALEVQKDIQKLLSHNDEISIAQQKERENHLRELSLEFNCLVNFVGFKE